jgi:hypothetical protein
VEYRSYQVAMVVVYGVLVAIVVGLAFSAESLDPNPDYSVPLAIGAFLAFVGVIGFYVRFGIMRSQLDRHDGSIPMPGLLGAVADIEDDDSDGGGEVSAEDLVAEISPDQGPPIRSVRCPWCGTEEPRGDSKFCRGCGKQLPSE